MYTTNQLRKACEGKSASDGSLNVTDLRTIAKKWSPKNDRIDQLSRQQLLDLLCIGKEPRYTLESEVVRSRELNINADNRENVFMSNTEPNL